MNQIDRIKQISDDEIIQLFQLHETLSSVLRHLNINDKHTSVRAYMVKRIAELGIQRVQHNADRLTYTSDDLRAALQTAQCWSDVFRKLGLTICFHNKKAVLNAAKKAGIDIPAFESKTTFRRGKHQFTIDDIFCENSKYSRTGLRKATIRFNVIGECRCSKCGLGNEWQGESITIELDHINGISNDNRPSNLRWLCPNCHSQTHTFKNSSKKSCS